MSTEPTDATLPRKELIDLMRDGAVARDAANSRRRGKAGKILRLFPMERMGDLIEIETDEEDPRCFVAEVISRNRDRVETTAYAIAVAGECVPERFELVDHALLAVVAYRHNGANMNDRGWEFAARALGAVPKGDLR